MIVNKCTKASVESFVRGLDIEGIYCIFHVELVLGGVKGENDSRVRSNLFKILQGTRTTVNVEVVHH